MNGFYFIDKPLDMTSFDIIRILRKKFDMKKMWHTGTLDPLASWGLFIATGNYTKLIPYFEKDEKEYEFTVSLNGKSISMDLGTPVDYVSQEDQVKYKEDLHKQDLQKIIDDNFSWEIIQVPPKYSALKINGKTALDRVKSGEEFEMKSRKATVKCIEILSYAYPELKIRATVTAGTYIRSIASDMWEIIGSGAHITELRRTKVGKYKVTDAVGLDDITIEDKFEIEKIFPKDRYISLEKGVLEKINNGLQIKWPFDFPVGVDLFITDNEEITNIVHYDWDVLIAKKRI